MARTKFDTIADYYAENLEGLRLFANKILNDTEEAKDVVQECFVRLLAIEDSISLVSMPALVHNMLRNAAVSVVRHRAIARQYNEVESAATSAATESLEVRIMARDIARHATRHIEALPDSCRTIFQMSLYDGMKVGEIASTLNIKYKFAEKQLGKARKKVREGLRNVV